MTHAYITDAVKEIVTGFIIMARLYKYHSTQMTPNIVICKGLLVGFFNSCVTSVMHNTKKYNELLHCSTHYR